MHDLIQVPPHRRCSLGTRSIRSVVLLEQIIQPASLIKPQALLMSPCCFVAAGDRFWAATWSADCTQGAVSAECFAPRTRDPSCREGSRCSGQVASLQCQGADGISPERRSCSWNFGQRWQPGANASVEPLQICNSLHPELTCCTSPWRGCSSSVLC